MTTKGDLWDRSLFIAWGAGGKSGGGFWAKQGEIYPIPPLNVTSLQWSPNNIWWLSRPPPPPHPMSSFSKQKWVIPPPNPSKVFIDSPLLGSQLRLIPPFVLLKIKWSPPGINNDRSLIHFMNRIAPFDFEHAKVHLILLANPEVMGWNKRCLT